MPIHDFNHDPGAPVAQVLYSDRTSFVNNTHFKLTCAQCQGLVIGAAWVHPDGELTCDSHAEPYRREQLGLKHCCPVCGGTGKVVDRGRLEIIDVEVPNTEASWVGPHYACELCDGEGYLAKEPVPVTETRTTGWKKG